MSESINSYRLTNKYYIIAEIGVNYYDIAKKYNISNMDAAKLMCRKAKQGGADAVKFQSYKAETIASKNSPYYWNLKEEPTTSQYELFKKYDSFGKNEYLELKKYCDEIKIEFMSTPFDYESVDYLNDIMNCNKISSSDLTNIPFIEYICEKGKPIILSVGASKKYEIDNAVNIIKKYGNKLTLLHCVLEYPTPYSHANLGRIKSLKDMYDVDMIGYSDHTKPDTCYDVIKSAYLLGARIIEKHFTLDKTLIGNDHYHAMDVDDLCNIRKSLDKIISIVGTGEIDCSEFENMARMNARRSIVLMKKLKKGDSVKRGDVTFKRPGLGISPTDLEKVIGKKVVRDLDEDSVLRWGDLCK